MPLGQLDLVFLPYLDPLTKEEKASWPSVVHVGDVALSSNQEATFPKFHLSSSCPLHIVMGSDRSTYIIIDCSSRRLDSHRCVNLFAIQIGAAICLLRGRAFEALENRARALRWYVFSLFTLLYTWLKLFRPSKLYISESGLNVLSMSYLLMKH